MSIVNQMKQGLTEAGRNAKGLFYSAEKHVVDAQARADGTVPRKVYVYKEHVIYAVAAAVGTVGLALLLVNPALGFTTLCIGILGAAIAYGYVEIKNTQAQGKVFGRLTECPLFVFETEKFLQKMNFLKKVLG